MVAEPDDPADADADAHETVTRSCATCGTQASAPGGGLPVGWAVGADGRGRTTFTCLDCSRRHLRSIEGKLDPEWW